MPVATNTCAPCLTFARPVCSLLLTCLLLQGTPPPLAHQPFKGIKQAASSFISRDQTGKWRSVCKAFKLVPDAEQVIDLHNPNNLSFVFNGAYTPVIPQIVNLLLTKGINSISEGVKYLPGYSVRARLGHRSVTAVHSSCHSRHYIGWSYLCRNCCLPSPWREDGTQVHHCVNWDHHRHQIYQWCHQQFLSVISSYNCTFVISLMYFIVSKFVSYCYFIFFMLSYLIYAGLL